MRSTVLFGALILSSTFSSAQSGSNDSQPWQPLVNEIRQLRKDLVATTVAAQRVQIVLYRLQGQQTAVERATERFDLAHSRLSDTESALKTRTAELQQNEDFLTQSQSESERKQVQEQVLPHLKADLERLRHLQQQQQVSESQSEEQLRAERAKLGDLENFLDKLDKSLAEFDRASH